MNSVSGRRQLDDYHGLLGAGNAGRHATVVSFLVFSAVSVGASFGALTLVKDALDRALGPGTVGRALQELDANGPDLHSLMSADSYTILVEESFARVKSREFGRRKTPRPQPETSVAPTTFMPPRKTGLATRHDEAEGFVEASRVAGGQTIEAVERTPWRM